MKLKNLNKVDWLVISIVFCIVFGVLSNVWENLIYACAISFIYPFCFSMVMIYHAIKNTIKEL